MDFPSQILSFKLDNKPFLGHFFASKYYRMPVKIGVVSQKGGVGKSTLCRLLAREYAANNWEVKIADMDVSQSTSFNWNSRRLQQNIQPAISVEQFAEVKRALKLSQNHDLIIFDGAPSSNRLTLEIAQTADLILLPTGTALDDLEPTIKLAHELKKRKIPRQKIALVLSRIGTSKAEIEEAKDYISITGYTLIDGLLEEKTAYRRASDLGQALTETPYPSLNQKADFLVQNIIHYLHKLDWFFNPN